MARRDFLKMTGLAAGSLAVAELPLVAGPFTRKDFTKLVPADKKLDPAWVKSLFARGSRAVYRWPESQKIGMPIGGICAGQLYLGGDGKLWHWDIFNQIKRTGAGHYANPLQPASPIEQGFAVKLSQAGQSQVRPLDHTGWRDIEFTGEYPIGYVQYRDATAPVAVSLEAFSPFIPLNPEDSALPATVMQFTLKNTSAQAVEAELAGWLENGVCLHSAATNLGQRRNRIVRRDAVNGGAAATMAGFTFLECSAAAAPPNTPNAQRPDIPFDDFEHETYGDWTATGTAFGSGPVATSQIPNYQGTVGAHGQRTVNSHATAPGGNVQEKDGATGMLTSRAFLLERDYITFLIGGGAHQGKTCLNLLVHGKVVQSATGKNNNRMQPQHFDVRRWQGKAARLQIVDAHAGGWGNIGVDNIVFSDRPQTSSVPLVEQPDYGTMGLALLRETSAATAEPAATTPDAACSALPPSAKPAEVFAALAAATDATTRQSFGRRLAGALSRKVRLAPGQAATVTFVVTWHFPNVQLVGLKDYEGRWYGKRLGNALAAAAYAAQHWDRLSAETRRWHDTWYDSTLPYWFLDRTMAPTSHLATSTCYWLGNGRFYGWEGVGCCAGTCTHVWHYAQAVARLFPSLERSLREMADYGAGFDPDTGRIRFRAEHNNHWAVDGQAGVILRTYREHQMCADSAFLRRVWPRAKKALSFLIQQDGNANGILEGSQHNTLDADWWGPVAWLSGLYCAALRAGAEMAREMGDESFARKCRQIYGPGTATIVDQLFDGEYFINQPDPKHLDAINSGTGCHIDQVLGQSWAWQVGLGRVLPAAQTRAALQALWRYNFTPDVGPWRKQNQPGRWYAMAGEGGLIMCTFPRSDWDYDKAAGQGPNWAAGYFNECMNGFEYQAAGHMIAEGLLQEGLAVTRMIHDRYHPTRRNPWNEVECGDHYARSMASYGVYLSACGYAYHGPEGRLGFAPRLRPEKFKCAFTAAEGWGSYSREFETAKLKAQIHLRWGRLRLGALVQLLSPDVQPSKVAVTLAGQSVPAKLVHRGDQAEIRFEPPLTLHAGDQLEAVVS